MTKLGPYDGFMSENVFLEGLSGSVAFTKPINIFDPRLVHVYMCVCNGGCSYLQMYYAGRNSFSPVYSLSFSRTSLFVALASGVRMLDFTV